ncbi:SRPBCC domain-containing protein [Kibdelosporangium aridum]|uniref:SRPBCC domain-containing protein n=1 Tax=Kibdelosporangium aridum TaxID=2030 RepID=UPI0037C0D344
MWSAITDPELSLQYWGHSNVSDRQVGSSCEHRRADGSASDVVGVIEESTAPRRLVFTWADPSTPDVRSKVTFDIQRYANRPADGHARRPRRRGGAACGGWWLGRGAVEHEVVSADRQADVVAAVESRRLTMRRAGAPSRDDGCPRRGVCR